MAKVLQITLLLQDFLQEKVKSVNVMIWKLFGILLNVTIATTNGNVTAIQNVVRIPKTHFLNMSKNCVASCFIYNYLQKILEKLRKLRKSCCHK